MEKGKKLYILTNGCPENRIDASLMQEVFKADGWSFVNKCRNADVILFNACALTTAMEENSIEMIKAIKAQKRPFTELIVCGCLPKINPGRLREVYQGFTFGSDEVEQLSNIIETRASHRRSHVNSLIPATYEICDDRWFARNFRWITISVPKVKRLLTADCSLTEITGLLISRFTKFCPLPFNRTVDIYRPGTFFIKVSTGCLNTCSYCGVKLSRGSVKSKSIDHIMNEFEEGLAKGYSEFVLLGTDLGSYGRDQDVTLAFLLREMVKRKGNYNIKLRNIHPRFLIEMLPEFLEIFQCGKITFLSSAIQSGNNRILEQMKRGYKIEDCKEAFLALRRQFPKLEIHTQVMVGFPSETEREFEDTLRVLDEINLNYTESYIFQPRPGTQATEMKDRVQPKAAWRRYYKLHIREFLRTLNANGPYVMLPLPGSELGEKCSAPFKHILLNRLIRLLLLSLFCCYL